MKLAKGTFLALGALALLTVGCTAETTDAPDAEGTPADTEAECACDAGKGGDNVWCEKCEHGYIGGEMATECKACFDNGGEACAACADK